MMIFWKKLPKFVVIVDKIQKDNLCNCYLKLQQLPEAGLIQSKNVYPNSLFCW